MKLGFKSSLTRKRLFHINLRANFNWSLGSNPVLPSSDLGEAYAGVGAKGDSLPLRSVRTEHRRGVACAEWHSGESAGPSLSAARNALGTARRDRHSRTREEVWQCLWPENTFVEFDNSLCVAIRKVRDALNDDADTPRYVETLPRRGYRFVAPVTVLSSEAAAQPAEILTPVAGVGIRNTSTSAALNSHGHRRRYWVIAASVLALVGAAVYGFRSLPRRASSKAEASGLMLPIRARRSVAVLGFRNLPGRPDDSWLSPAFAEMLTTELASDGALRMVPGEDVARVKRELPIPDEDSLAKTTLERLRINPGADVVILGSYTALPGNGDKRIRLDVRVQDTVHGETIAEKSFTGSEGNLFELATQAGQALRQSLGISPASNEASLQARAALPSNQEAVRFYTESQERLWAFDYGHARDLLTKAVASDPGYPLAHAALADAWNHLGYASKARAEIERARALSGHLGPEDRLLIDGQYYSPSRIGHEPSTRIGNCLPSSRTTWTTVFDSPTNNDG